MKKLRLDEELVAQGFFSNKQDALRAVLAGEVSTDSRRLTSAGERVKSGIYLHVKGHLPYVSRGGFKLEGGLDTFKVDASSLKCLDVGCSTGGFTDCLLKRGASSVTSVDVGYAQFDWSLRNNDKVELLERTNICDVTGESYDNSYDLAVCDVSFTSVSVILPSVVNLLKEDGMFLTLVKPQFECKREEVGQGGIVRDKQVRLATLTSVANSFVEEGLDCLGACVSSITGTKGNVEFLLLGKKTQGSATCNLDLESVVYEGIAQIK